MSGPEGGKYIDEFLQQCDARTIKALCAFALLQLVYICGTHPEVLKEFEEQMKRGPADGESLEFVNGALLALVQAELMQAIEAFGSEHPNG